jgi:hypothetical protein
VSMLLCRDGSAILKNDEQCARLALRVGFSALPFG